jgi:hypothetical protein
MWSTWSAVCSAARSPGSSTGTMEIRLKSNGAGPPAAFRRGWAPLQRVPREGRSFETSHAQAPAGVELSLFRDRT